MRASNLDVPMKGLELWACAWDDAHYNGGEFERHEIIHRPIKFVTNGILLQDDEVGVSLASDICEDGTFRGINFVPRNMVIETWKVGALTRRARKAKGGSGGVNEEGRAPDI